MQTQYLQRPGLVFLLAGLGPRAVFAQTTEANDSASLAQLHDIIVPAPVAPWWPPAPGWYLLAGLCMVLSGWGFWRMLRRRGGRRYRVEALAELHALRRDTADPREVVGGILVLLKRTALGAYPRVQVASLNGAAWWRFLDLSGARTRFSEGLGELAEEVVYERNAEALSTKDLKRLFRAAAKWIKRHRPAIHQSASAIAADNTPRPEA